jgi:hypothetical protein
MAGFEMSPEACQQLEVSSGIFIVLADIARPVRCPGLMITIRGTTAVRALIAALSYAEKAI